MRRQARARRRARLEELSLASDSPACEAGCRRSAHQSVRRWRRNRDSLGVAGAEAADRRAADCTLDLGNQTSAEVVRVVWPNGTVRAEFGVNADQEVVTEQRLKASCPFLFAWNGTEMDFVKDAVPWGSAIGLRINTLGTAKIATTGEWYKIRRDQLVPHDGYYDLRITGGALGSLLLRSHRADDRRPSGGHRNLRRRAIS